MDQTPTLNVSFPFGDVPIQSFWAPLLTMSTFEYADVLRNFAINFKKEHMTEAINLYNLKMTLPLGVLERKLWESYDSSGPLRGPDHAVQKACFQIYVGLLSSMENHYNAELQLAMFCVDKTRLAHCFAKKAAMGFVVRMSLRMYCTTCANPQTYARRFGTTFLIGDSFMHGELDHNPTETLEDIFDDLLKFKAEVFSHHPRFLAGCVADSLDGDLYPRDYAKMVLSKNHVKDVQYAYSELFDYMSINRTVHCNENWFLAYNQMFALASAEEVFDEDWYVRAAEQGDLFGGNLYMLPTVLPDLYRGAEHFASNKISHFVHTIERAKFHGNFPCNSLMYLKRHLHAGRKPEDYAPEMKEAGFQARPCSNPFGNVSYAPHPIWDWVSDYVALALFWLSICVVLSLLVLLKYAYHKFSGHVHNFIARILWVVFVALTSPLWLPFYLVRLLVGLELFSTNIQVSSSSEPVVPAVVADLPPAQIYIQEAASAGSARRVAPLPPASVVFLVKDEAGVYNQHGMGVLVQNKEKFYIMTAHHVLPGLLANSSYLATGSEGSWKLQTLDPKWKVGFVSAAADVAAFCVPQRVVSLLGLKPAKCLRVGPAGVGAVVYSIANGAPCKSEGSFNPHPTDVRYVLHATDTGNGGASGSPLYILSRGTYYVIGIHLGFMPGEKSNYAVLIGTPFGNRPRMEAGSGGPSDISYNTWSVYSDYSDGDFSYEESFNERSRGEDDRHREDWSLEDYFVPDQKGYRGYSEASEDARLNEMEGEFERRPREHKTARWADQMPENGYLNWLSPSKGGVKVPTLVNPPKEKEELVGESQVTMEKSVVAVETSKSTMETYEVVKDVQRLKLPTVPSSEDTASQLLIRALVTALQLKESGSQSADSTFPPEKSSPQKGGDSKKVGKQKPSEPKTQDPKPTQGQGLSKSARKNQAYRELKAKALLFDQLQQQQSLMQSHLNSTSSLGPLGVPEKNSLPSATRRSEGSDQQTQ
jgi:hypothetical protein